MDPKGSCIQATSSHEEPIDCPTPTKLLQSSADYRVERLTSQPYTITHIYACGSAGQCRQKVREFQSDTDEKCCDNQPKRTLRVCKENRLLLILNNWQLTRQGVCTKFITKRDVTASLQRSCSPPFDVRLGVCTADGHAVEVTTRRYVDNCECKVSSEFRLSLAGQLCEVLSSMLVSKVKINWLLHHVSICNTVSAAEVVFLVDESVASRQPHYQTHVQQLLRKTIELFLLSRHTQGQANSYRFAVIKYAWKPSIAFNLHQHTDPNRMLENVEELVFEGERANLDRALRIVQQEVLPLKRSTAPMLLYIVTDGHDIIPDQSPVIRLIEELQNEQIQINVIAVAAEPGRLDYLERLVTQPKTVHLIPVSAPYTVKTYLDKLIETLCIRVAVLPLKRSTAPMLLYIVTDGHDIIPDQSPVIRLIEELQNEQIQINVIAVAAEPGRLDYLERLVTQPKTVHLIPVSAPYTVKTYLDKLIETLCIRACPTNYVTESKCSRETGCVGRTYVHTYRFDQRQNQCVGTTEVKSRRCCKLKLKWIAESSVSWPPTGGYMTDEFYPTKTCEKPTRKLVKSISKRIVRCRCDGVKKYKRCFADKVQVRVVITQQLINGECHPRKSVRLFKLNCPPPTVFKSNCDQMTCQRRLTIVNYATQRCHCERRVQVKYETCCCRGSKSISYEGCRQDVLKAFVERTIEPALQNGSCVQRTRYHFEPVACPKNPQTIRHKCRHVPSPETNLKQNTLIDPALVYRLVESFWWQIQSCECRRIRQAFFEACGCDQSRIPVESQKIHRCNAVSGVLIMYDHLLKLEIDGTQPNNRAGMKLPGLTHAKCRPHYKMTSARKIVCPATKRVITGCELADDGRKYRMVQIHRWSRKQCACVSLPIEFIDKRVCACRPKRALKRCVNTVRSDGIPQSRFIVKILDEVYINERDANGNSRGVCKPAPIQTKVQAIVCPRSQIRYSRCMNGRVRITVKLIMTHNCECRHRIRILTAKCRSLSPKVDGHQIFRKTSGQLPSRHAGRSMEPSRSLVMPLYQLAECIDLLSASQCQALEHPPYRICEARGHVNRLLCRRTCQKCSTCPTDNTRFRFVGNHHGDSCIVSDQRYDRVFFLRSIVHDANLARCKKLASCKNG
ncbi:hypothetical protein AHF37_07350 [Paragonimus kellicotti]|nr:hypothetical protein AHF37_07350 [Paragonimus kellicotti]